MKCLMCGEEMIFDGAGCEMYGDKKYHCNECKMETTVNDEGMIREKSFQ
jgi:predicted RNA-binding Zn-ribbon protein involved in translation (DUF1610 family)